MAFTNTIDQSIAPSETAGCRLQRGSEHGQALMSLRATAALWCCRPGVVGRRAGRRRRCSRTRRAGRAADRRCFQAEQQREQLRAGAGGDRGDQGGRGSRPGRRYGAEATGKLTGARWRKRTGCRARAHPADAGIRGDSARGDVGVHGARKGLVAGVAELRGARRRRGGTKVKRQAGPVGGTARRSRGDGRRPPPAPGWPSSQSQQPDRGHQFGGRRARFITAYRAAVPRGIRPRRRGVCDS